MYGQHKICNIIAMVVRLPVPRWESLSIQLHQLCPVGLTIAFRNLPEKGYYKSKSIPSESYGLYLHVTKHVVGEQRGQANTARTSNSLFYHLRGNQLISCSMFLLKPHSYTH